MSEPMIRPVLHVLRWLLAPAFLAVLLLAGAPSVSAGHEAAPALVSPAWLKQHLADADLVVLDIRSAIDGGGAEAYRTGHIPGAVHSDYDKAGWRVTGHNPPLMLPTVG